MNVFQGLVMEAVILAAGQGARLGRVPGLPKCLQSVGGRPLLEHQIRTLQHFGVSRILVVVGSEAICVQGWLSAFAGVEYVTNEQFASTNSLFSLSLAKHWVSSDFLLLNCDVLAHPSIYREILAADGALLTYDSSSTLADEEMKVQVRDGRLKAISKEISPSEADGENLGIIRFSQEMIAPLFKAIDEIIAAGNHRAWAPMALNQLVSTHELPCFDVAGWPWIEIDFIGDLYRACDDVWPQIAEAMSALRLPQHKRESSVLRLAERAHLKAGIPRTSQA